MKPIILIIFSSLIFSNTLFAQGSFKLSDKWQGQMENYKKYYQNMIDYLKQIKGKTVYDQRKVNLWYLGKSQVVWREKISGNECWDSKWYKDPTEGCPTAPPSPIPGLNFKVLSASLEQFPQAFENVAEFAQKNYRHSALRDPLNKTPSSISWNRIYLEKNGSLIMEFQVTVWVHKTAKRPITEFECTVSHNWTGSKLKNNQGVKCNFK